MFWKKKITRSKTSSSSSGKSLEVVVEMVVEFFTTQVSGGSLDLKNVVGVRQFPRSSIIRDEGVNNGLSQWAVKICGKSDDCVVT